MRARQQPALSRALHAPGRQQRLQGAAHRLRKASELYAACCDPTKSPGMTFTGRWSCAGGGRGRAPGRGKRSLASRERREARSDPLPVQALASVPPRAGSAAPPGARGGTPRGLAEQSAGERMPRQVRGGRGAGAQQPGLAPPDWLGLGNCRSRRAHLHNVGVQAGGAHAQGEV